MCEELPWPGPYCEPVFEEVEPGLWNISGNYNKGYSLRVDDIDGKVPQIFDVLTIGGEPVGFVLEKHYRSIDGRIDFTVQDYYAGETSGT